jgi:hypothetical protein
LFYLEPHLSFSVDGQVVNSVKGIGSLPKPGVTTLSIPGIKAKDQVYDIWLINLDDTDTIEISNCVAKVEK